MCPERRENSVVNAEFVVGRLTGGVDRRGSQTERLRNFGQAQTTTQLRDDLALAQQ